MKILYITSYILYLEKRDARSICDTLDFVYDKRKLELGDRNETLDDMLAMWRLGPGQEPTVE